MRNPLFPHLDIKYFKPSRGGSWVGFEGLSSVYPRRPFDESGDSSYIGFRLFRTDEKSIEEERRRLEEKAARRRRRRERLGI